MQSSGFLFCTFVAIVAALVLCTVYLSPNTYCFSCVVLPTALALAFRSFQKSSHGLALLVATGSAIVIGSSMAAFGSYCQTFIHGAQGFLVGGGWQSVAAAGIVGAFVGLFCGMISILIYFLIAVTVKGFVLLFPNHPVS